MTIPNRIGRGVPGAHSFVASGNATGPLPDGTSAPASGPDAPPEPFAPAVRVLLAVTCIAGFQHHHGMHPRVLWSLRAGEELQAVREPGNPYDPLAVALYTPDGARLGYLPRGLNEPVAHLFDQGFTVRAVVAEVDPEAEPWKRVRVQVTVALPAPIFFWEN